jgi:hypothetical protein
MLTSFYSFSPRPYRFKGLGVCSNSLIGTARIASLCILDGEAFSLDVSKPDSKIWFVIWAGIGKPERNVSNRELLDYGPKLKSVLFATDGESFVPVQKIETPGPLPELLGYTVHKTKKKGFWARFGPPDKALVNALIKRKLLAIGASQKVV